ncbi:MAG TPA: prolyl oligopeptidase family serine peptidase [Williamwhitmania sp.]|nr:prolyl oligopeptidase family serine peptidase [Williamwhitmania sp.]
MKRVSLIIAALVLVLTSCNFNHVKYPKTKKVDQVDTYFGVKVADPYRWLENDRSPEVEEWVKAENAVTNDYLSKIPFREKLKQRLTKVWNYEKMGVPIQRGSKLFYQKNSGLENQSILYMQNGVAGTPVVLLDPNKLSSDGTVAVSDYEVSKDGKYLAYATSDGGSDWQTIYIKNIATGAVLNDTIKWVKFSTISWYRNGFFYSGYDVPQSGTELTNINENQKVYYHEVGTKQVTDKVIYHDNDYPLRNFTTQVTDDDKYLILYVTESTSGNNILIKNLQRNEDFVQLTIGFEFDYKVIDHIDDNLYVLTNYKAPKYRLVSINVKAVDVGNWREIIPEKSDVLQNASLSDNKIICNYIQDAHSDLEIYNTKGDLLSTIKLPTLGTASALSTERNDTVGFYSFTSFAYPSTIFKYNLETGRSTEFFKPKVDADLSQYDVEQAFFISKDGTKVPMFIVHKKNIVLDGTNPTLLYGYGGFNISLMPYFSASRLLWLENGGVYAVANIRGGGEYGENWHKAGTKLNKQNVFDDFIAAAEYLVDKKYTNPKKLAIEGGSNGGLLIGAVVNQRPDLFQVAIPEVGVMDMLRFQKFTIGWSWVSDYGSSDDSLQFENLYRYSPLHNIRSNVTYPATLVITADHDDRVVPAHSFKYIATLQEKQARKRNPMLIRIQTRAGHGMGKPTSIAIDEIADIYSFIFYNMDVVPKE